MMKSYKAINTRNGKEFIVTVPEDKNIKVMTYDVEKNVSKEIAHNTLKRWFELGEEIKVEKKEEKKETELFWYEYRLRGFSLGCQPKGFITHDDSIGKHGAVAYDRELTDKEIAEYELNVMKKEKNKVTKKKSKKPTAVKKDGSVRKDKFRPKLNEKQVIEIREKFKAGSKKSHLAKEYNVSFRTITCIVEYIMWKNVG